MAGTIMKRNSFIMTNGMIKFIAPYSLAVELNNGALQLINGARGQSGK